MPRMTEYQRDLIESLKDPTEAAEYLNAAIEEDAKEAFLLALRNVVEARGGMKTVAEKAHVNRESLYRSLSRRGNPELRTLFTLLRCMGLKLAVQPKEVERCDTLL